MDIDSLEQAPRHECVDDVGYAVFYSDSEDMAKLLATSYAVANINKNEKPVDRPTIPFVRWLLGLILPLVLYAITTMLAVLYSDAITIWPFIAGYIIIFLLTIKPFVVLFVLVYQRIAPERMRRSCRFEPTCSNYMLQAIDKYGFWCGFFKGIGRLFRCRYPNGGVDLP